jgi:hypothetical protein
MFNLKIINHIRINIINLKGLYCEFHSVSPAFGKILLGEGAEVDFVFEL